MNSINELILGPSYTKCPCVWPSSSLLKLLLIFFSKCNRLFEVTANTQWCPSSMQRFSPFQKAEGKRERGAVGAAFCFQAVVVRSAAAGPVLSLGPQTRMSPTCGHSRPCPLFPSAARLHPPPRTGRVCLVCCLRQDR